MNKKISFKHCLINLAYRDDSDLSVIDEFFVDKMYKSVEPIISAAKFPILDIGAHIGLFSIYARLLNPTVPIIALEPEPDNYKLLKNNLKLNNIKNVIPIHTAIVTGKESNTKLYLSKNTHNHSTLLDPRFHGDDTCVIPAHAGIQSSIAVPAINLAQLIEENKIKKIGLLKMDIEGAEFAILRSLDFSVFSKIQNMAIEYHESKHNKRADLENIIKPHGFSVEHFPNKFDKRFGLLICRNKNLSR